MKFSAPSQKPYLANQAFGGGELDIVGIPREQALSQRSTMTESESEAEEQMPCPCEKKSTTPQLLCRGCSTWWHLACVSLKGLSAADAKKIKEWKCPFCYVLPEKVQINSGAALAHLTREIKKTKSEVITELKNDAKQVHPIQEKTWADLFTKNQEAMKEQQKEVVKEVVEKSKQRLDADNMERERRRKNVMIQ